MHTKAALICWCTDDVNRPNLSTLQFHPVIHNSHVNQSRANLLLSYVSYFLAAGWTGFEFSLFLKYQEFLA